MSASMPAWLLDPLLRRAAEVVRDPSRPPVEVERVLLATYVRGYSEHQIGEATGLSPVDVLDMVVRAQAA